LLFCIFGLIEKHLDKNGNDSQDGYSYSDSAGQLYYKNNWYVVNDAVESYLILGIDHSVENSLEARSDSQQTDFIALLILNKDKESYQILQLNRDTMADIPRKDISGNDFGTVRAQLALAHTYGDTERERCRNTVKTVEKLLYGISVDHYLSVTMDAVPVVNDAVGGVTVTLTDDFTHIDPAFGTGATVTLYGDQALAYVRSRSSLEDKTNLNRMERQREYVSALCEKLRDLDEEDIMECFADINEYLASDCTVDQMTRLAERLESYAFEGILVPEGEAVMGEKYIEFNLDDASVQEMVVELFYEPRKQE